MQRIVGRDAAVVGGTDEFGPCRRAAGVGERGEHGEVEGSVPPQ